MKHNVHDHIVHVVRFELGGEEFARKQTVRFCLATVTLKFDQGHQNLHGSMKLNGGCHYAKFDRSQLHSFRERVNVKVFGRNRI